jgi:hypothetical protein
VFNPVAIIQHSTRSPQYFGETMAMERIYELCGQREVALTVVTGGLGGEMVHSKRCSRVPREENMGTCVEKTGH